MPEETDYIPAYDAWVQFANDNAAIGLSKSQGSFRRFVFVYGDQLKASGSLVKANGRYLMAHKTQFRKDAFAALLGKLEATTPPVIHSPEPERPSFRPASRVVEVPAGPEPKPERPRFRPASRLDKTP